MNRNEVLSLVESVVDATRSEILQYIDSLTNAVEQLKPCQVKQLTPVAIQPGVVSGNTNLDLIKSLPQFGGNSSEYPAWRESAKFAINYYSKGSESYYVAMGILRNKIIGEANSTLSSFNTIFNFDAIIARLDQSYSDKRPLYLLENELSVLRQGKLTINDYYDNVNKQLTLIVNKIIMDNTGREEVIEALNERARANALRVFISGLRKPLCDICFSANPQDLPTALATAQELEQNHERYRFANAFASSKNLQQSQPSYSKNNLAKVDDFQRIPIDKQILQHPLPIPMEVDRGTSYFRKPTAFFNVLGPQPQSANHNYSGQRPNSNGNTSKRQLVSANTNRSPNQRINYVQNYEEDDLYGSEVFSCIGVEDDASDHLNFLV